MQLRLQQQQQQLQPLAVVGVAAGGTTVVDEGALAGVVAVRVFSPQRRVFVAPVQLAAAANAVGAAADAAAGVVAAAAGTVAADVTEAARGKSDYVEEVLTKVRVRVSQKGKLAGTEPRTGTGTVVSLCRCTHLDGWPRKEQPQASLVREQEQHPPPHGSFVRRNISAFLYSRC